MFKKEIDIIDEKKMTPKERKNFKKSLKKNFDKTAIDKLFLYIDYFYMKKQKKSKMVFYTDETDPIFVDSTSKKDFFPTVYTLSQFPTLVPFFLKLKKNVENILKKGGQVMWSSVSNLDELGEFQPDSVIGLKDSNGNVFGIGALACGYKDLEEKKEGVAAYVLHHKFDRLFEFGSGDLKKVVFDGVEKIEKIEENDEKIEEEEEDGDDFMGGFVKQVKKGNNGGFQKGKKMNKKQRNKFKADKKNNDDDNNFDFSKKKRGKKGKKGKKDVFEEMESKERMNNNQGQNKKGKKGKKGKMGGNTKEMDDNIMEAFLNAIKISVDDKELPINTSVFWEEHILACANPDYVLDLKKSSFKKKGKFFSYLDKQGYIKYNESSKKNLTPQVVDILRMNDKIENWEPTILKKQSKEQEEQEEKKLEIVNKITNFCTPKDILKKYLKTKKERYSKTEFEKLIKDYLKKEKLLKGSDVVINDDLKQDFDLETEEFQDSSESENEDEDENKKKKKKFHLENTIPLKKLLEILEKYLLFQYEVFVKSTGSTLVYDGEFKGPTIFAEKSHNKFVTRVISLNLYGINLELLLKEWMKKYDTAGVLTESKGNDPSEGIKLEGTFFDEVKDFLLYELKFKEDEIILVNKISKKKKNETFF